MWAGPLLLRGVGVLLVGIWGWVDLCHGAK